MTLQNWILDKNVSDRISTQMSRRHWNYLEERQMQTAAGMSRNTGVAKLGITFVQKIEQTNRIQSFHIKTDGQGVAQFTL